MTDAVRQADDLEQFHRLLRGGRKREFAPLEHRHLHVLHRREHGQQIERLEYEADLLRPQAIYVADRRDRLSLEVDFA